MSSWPKPRPEVQPAGLTRRRREILLVIDDLIEEHGYSPTFREIMSAIGIHSPSTLHVHLHALKSTGWIDFEPRSPRTIRVLRRP